ncbi:hypothetical protein LY78DRAFT_651790 [Colletotrichum sublineola]|nr:hypothetical protein LY78DRAFT_651790 [Colletotrichum sublineola]
MTSAVAAGGEWILQLTIPSYSTRRTRLRLCVHELALGVAIVYGSGIIRVPCTLEPDVEYREITVGRLLGGI